MSCSPHRSPDDVTAQYVDKDGACAALQSPGRVIVPSLGHAPRGCRPSPMIGCERADHEQCRPIHRVKAHNQCWWYGANDDSAPFGRGRYALAWGGRGDASRGRRLAGFRMTALVPKKWLTHIPVNEMKTLSSRLFSIITPLMHVNMVVVETMRHISTQVRTFMKSFKQV